MFSVLGTVLTLKFVSPPTQYILPLRLFVILFIQIAIYELKKQCISNRDWYFFKNCIFFYVCRIQPCTLLDNSSGFDILLYYFTILFNIIIILIWFNELRLIWYGFFNHNRSLFIGKRWWIYHEIIFSVDYKEEWFQYYCIVIVFQSIAILWYCKFSKYCNNYCNIFRYCKKWKWCKRYCNTFKVLQKVSQI